MSSSDPCLVISCYNNGHFGYGNYGHYGTGKVYDKYNSGGFIALYAIGGLILAIVYLAICFYIPWILWGIWRCLRTAWRFICWCNPLRQRRTAATPGAPTLPTIPNLTQLREVLVAPNPDRRLALVRFNQPEMVSGQVWGMPREFGVPGEPPATYQKAEAALRSSLAVLSPKAQL